jgi:O-methyltransferase
MGLPTESRSMNDATNIASPLDLYLDLLKKSLTDTLFHAEPELDQADLRRTMLHVRHYVDGRAISMLPLARLDQLQNCVIDVIRRGVPGDLIEAGVWRGGATILMRATLKALCVTDRTVWVADSFEGLPKPDAERFPLEARAHRGPIIQTGFRNFAASLNEVKDNFRAYGLLDDQVRFLKGWFKDTLGSAPIQRIAVLRLDGDFYESTMDGLCGLYDRLAIGGYAIIDDYGEDAWTNCRKAVDDFRTERGIDDRMISVDSKCYYWQRSR